MPWVRMRIWLEPDEVALLKEEAGRMNAESEVKDWTWRSALTACLSEGIEDMRARQSEPTEAQP